MDLDEKLDTLFRQAGESGLSTLAAVIDVEEGLRQLETRSRASGKPAQTSSPTATGPRCR